MNTTAAQTEIVVTGQRETSIESELLRTPGERPLVVLTINGPDNALCLTFQRSTLRILIERLTDLHKEMR